MTPDLPSLSPREREALDAFVQRLYSQHKEHVRSLVLFGSKARGDAGPDSDVDLLARLTNDDPYLRSTVRRLAARVSLEYDLLLSVQAVSWSRWDELSHYRFPLYRALESEGVELTPQP
ncbi:MAG: nucleotidyltransferase domain-containing protein [Anaerolineae bacterium]|jgi:predicted nucleotidyltransferase